MSEVDRPQFDPDFAAFAQGHDLQDWEGWWSPYDEAFYAAVLDTVTPDDVVLEIGAGELRLARRLAEKVARVYAVEVNPRLVAPALAAVGYDLPRNLHVVCANALDFPFPPDITVAVLLMRHCRHFAVYTRRLRAVGCRRLVTNARWGLDVEVVDLAAAVPWTDFRGGWYACLCGRVGFVAPTAGDEYGEVAVNVRECGECGGERDSLTQR